MENPFESIENRLSSIERKLDGLIERIEDPKSSSPVWLTSKQLAQHLGISISTVSKIRGSKLPYYKLGGKICFKKQEIDELIEKTKHKTGGEFLNEYLNSK